jgi:hypothetical protein
VNSAHLIYTHDHRASVEAVREYLETPVNCSVGRFGEWAHDDMNHSILVRERAVEAILPQQVAPQC